MSERRSAWLQRMMKQLLPEGPRTLTLDEIGDALGVQAIGADLVEELIDLLQSEGAQVVGTAGGDELPILLRRVIQCAQQLRAKGDAPSPQNIAESSGISVRAVRVALLYANVLKG